MPTLDDISHIRISDYDYPLPDERIARHPLARREQCKLLVWRADGTIDDLRFDALPALLPADTMLIYNNTRVINARLRFRKATGSLVEIFCLEPVEPLDYALIFQTTESCTWRCLVGNNKRWKDDTLSQIITVGDRPVTLTARRAARHGNAFDIVFTWDSGVTFASVLEATGEIPIPPYLNRNSEESDKTDYQTVYSHIDGSVAAPTAGLHFTDAVLDECDRRGITRRELTLHVGAGTFQPVKSETIGDHPMHHEFISVPRSLLVDIINHRGHIVAVGTTSVRTLESLYYIGATLLDNPESTAEDLTVEQWQPYRRDYTYTAPQALQAIVDYLDATGSDRYEGDTQLMIAPGYRYRIVDGMVTNFHQPQSTLLLLVSAFTGGQHWRDIYRHALDADYRFLSYGDATLLLGEAFGR